MAIEEFVYEVSIKIWVIQDVLQVPSELLRGVFKFIVQSFVSLVDLKSGLFHCYFFTLLHIDTLSQQTYVLILIHAKGEQLPNALHHRVSYHRNILLAKGINLSKGFSEVEFLIDLYSEYSLHRLIILLRLLWLILLTWHIDLCAGTLDTVNLDFEDLLLLEEKLKESFHVVQLIT
jgi:hypothetical protein